MRVLQSKSIAEQVDEILLERIRSGEYLPGGRIPSETELSDELGVSRATVRTVLAKLASNGFILRKQGDGTYVNEHAHRASAHFGALIQVIDTAPTRSGSAARCDWRREAWENRGRYGASAYTARCQDLRE